MLIVNADDWGGNRTATDNTLDCFRAGRITSASAMVFTKDSERAADLALETGLDVGLHVNFSQPFDGEVPSDALREDQRRIVRFLSGGKYRFLMYHPFLRKEFESVYHAQYEEFFRLYHKAPAHINGHHHMHLCANMLFSWLIPPGQVVRRNFTFLLGEKNIANTFYRRQVDRWLGRRYRCTDFFFSISPLQPRKRIERILELSKKWRVELMVHPNLETEYHYLMSDDYLVAISALNRVAFSSV